MENLSVFDTFIQVNNSFSDSYGSGSGNGYGDGEGCGCGCGRCNGSGNGYGDSDGYSYGDGEGCGCGCGRCSGSGNGYGDGSGDGCGRGYGGGSGYGYGIKMFTRNPVYLIDETPTLIYIVRGNIAKGEILKNDLTTVPCYIVKNGNLFAHGRTLREAQAELIEKQFYNMDDDDRIDAFLKEIDINKQYQTSVFFDWHHKLTGSCEMGRRIFAENHGIDLENGTMTVSEFVELTKNAYGGRIIKKIAEGMKVGGK